jgi:hypothetical protein
MKSMHWAHSYSHNFGTDCSQNYHGITDTRAEIQSHSGSFPIFYVTAAGSLTFNPKWFLDHEKVVISQQTFFASNISITSSLAQSLWIKDILNYHEPLGFITSITLINESALLQNDTLTFSRSTKNQGIALENRASITT